MEIPATDTIIFLMGYFGLDYLVEMLLKEDRFNQSTPIALISRASCADQQIITGSLSSICELASNNPIPTPVIVVVGKVVDLNKICSWVKHLPLFGKRVILCRQKTQYETWYNSLQLAGAEVVYLPLIETQLNSMESNQLSLSLLKSVTCLVFTSTNAVTHFFSILNINHLDIRNCSHLKIYSLGSSITELLNSYGLHPEFEAELANIKGVIDLFSQKLNSEHILYVTSTLASNELQLECETRGATFTRLNIYKTISIKRNPPIFLKTDYIIVTSPSVMDALLDLDTVIDKKTPLVVLGKRTYDYCKSLGFNTIYESFETNIDAVINTLANIG